MQFMIIMAISGNEVVLLVVTSVEQMRLLHFLLGWCNQMELQ
jgi:hypothetical protein